MSYLLDRFGTLILPQARPTSDMGAANSMRVFSSLPSGGAFDNTGSDQARGKPIVINHACAVVGDGPMGWQPQLDVLKALVGTRNKLYRQLPNGSTAWITAELTGCDASYGIDNINYQDVKLLFSSPDYYWHGVENVVTAALPGSGNVTVVNNGNYPVRNAIITIVAATAPVTALTINNTLTYLNYSGTITVGHTLVIDCGKYTVLNSSSDDRAHFTRLGSHALAEWLCLVPGNNVISLATTGGGAGSTIMFDFCDGWA